MEDCSTKEEESSESIKTCERDSNASCGYFNW